MQRKSDKLSEQVSKKVNKDKTKTKQTKQYDGNTEVMTSSGSTLLDLAVSGGRKRGGGFPSGILVEVFGPSGSGKTVILSEMAGGVKRQGGAVRFDDPEARLNKQFAKIFDLNVDEITYNRPNRVPEVFEPIRNLKVDDSVVNGCFADSLAALSTDLEMDNRDRKSVV